MHRKKEDRLTKIRQILEAEDSRSIRYLAQDLNVTPETIRSDLDVLEADGVVLREHGYVRL